MTKKNRLLTAFKNKKILITGGTGSIGSEIVRQLLPYEPDQIRVYSRDESKHFQLHEELQHKNQSTDIRFLVGDIRDKDRLDLAFGDIDIVFHTAAMKHVPFCEYNPFEAIKTNVYGTQNIIDLAIKHNIEKVVAISTDKAVNPSSILGTTKLLMEKMILSTRWYLSNATTKFSVVRFGNVLNSRGSAVPLWRQQIRHGGPVTLTDPEMTRYIMTISEAVRLIFKAASMMQGQEIFILKMPVKKMAELAQETIIRHAKTKKIEIKIIGKRTGEKLHESLLTEEEKETVIELKDMYVVTPYMDLHKTRTKTMYTF